MPGTGLTGHLASLRVPTAGEDYCCLHFTGERLRDLPSGGRGPQDGSLWTRGGRSESGEGDLRAVRAQEREQLRMEWNVLGPFSVFTKTLGPALRVSQPGCSQLPAAPAHILSMSPTPAPGARATLVAPPFGPSVPGLPWQCRLPLGYCDHGWRWTFPWTDTSARLK